jgi:hypothetical protein
MATLTSKLQAILTNIQTLNLDKTTLKNLKVLAVSKAQSTAAIRQAYDAGIYMFGENYLQEALEKQAQLTDLNIEWHFIGPIQSNKTQQIAQQFMWVQSLDRIKIAQRLNDARPTNMAPLQVCLQVNISGEASKSGVEPTELAALAKAIITMPRLQLRGLMAIPAPTLNLKEQQLQFKQVKACFEALVAEGFKLDTLSMGMSDDYLVAIEQGATMIRIGSGLFGARQYPTKL